MTAGFVSRSHRAIAPFELHRPSTIGQAVEQIAAGARPHAGGIDLLDPGVAVGQERFAGFAVREQPGERSDRVQLRRLADDLGHRSTHAACGATALNIAVSRSSCSVITSGVG